MKVIESGQDHKLAMEAAAQFNRVTKRVALTGAGVSVGSGIPDFRSEGGLWTVFAPDEYATLRVFLANPEKAWKLYRALGESLFGKQPNSAHLALASLENAGLLNGVITQNVDNLHQQAGSENVLEIHGDHQHLQCVQCGFLGPVTKEDLTRPDVPSCPDCSFPLKPNVVLFDEPVRRMEEIESLLTGCDLLMVLGTSGHVYPAAGLPAMVRANGGFVYEFNIDPPVTSLSWSRKQETRDYYFQGDVEETLPRFVDALEKSVP